MKTNTLSIFILMLSAIMFFNCKNEKKEPVEETTTKVEEIVKDPSIVEIETKSMEFIGPDTIPSGWITIKYNNMSTEPHFVLVDVYPEGKTIDTIKTAVLPPFDKGMELIMEGKTDEAMAAFGGLPEWFPQVVFAGGTGLVSPKLTGSTTLKLNPGKHFIECYVKMPNGQFHTSMGMLKEIWVTDEDSSVQPPDADVKISISSTEGINYEGEIRPGKQVFEVYFKDQIVHENFVGHDVNLVKLDENADLDALESWMNWANPKGLMSASLPEGVTFLGGANNAPTGVTQYFTATLTPGKYAFISEVPETRKKNMFKVFEVTID